MAQYSSTRGYARLHHERTEDRARRVSAARAPKPSNGFGSPLPSRTAIGGGGKWPIETNPAPAHGSSGDRLVQLRCSKRLHAHYCIGLATDRPTLSRTKDRAHSVAPRQQRNLAIPRRLQHARAPRRVIPDRSDPGPYIRLRHGGTEGSNPALSSGESGVNRVEVARDRRKE